MFSVQVFCYANGAAKDETGHRGNWLLMPVFLLLSQSIVDEWLASPSLRSKQETDRSERGMAASSALPFLSLRLSPHSSLWAALRHSHRGPSLPPPAAPTSLLFTSINEP